MTDTPISVRVLDVPFHIDRPFDYLLPHGVHAKRGSLVRVPFGGGNRPRWAVVMGESTPDGSLSLKPVLSVAEEGYALSEKTLGLCSFLSERYLCTFGDAVRTVIPHLLRDGGTPRTATRVWCEATLSPEATVTLLATKGALRSEAHKKILLHLATHGRCERTSLCESLGVNTQQIRALAEKGYLRLTEDEIIRNPYAELARLRDTSPIHLSRAQTVAFETLLGLYGTHKPKGALLHGVTGSGKTKIMLSMIDRVIADGRQVIMMVPEIALTPQTVAIFCSRYGERVAVIHSSLSLGERFDAWRRIARGDVDLVIGTRSAVFAPLERLGLIILDEEHEHTYKSEQDPKYHTREVAAFRAGQDDALLILASATPSFESYYKAKRGDYTLVPLTERYGGAVLPTAEVVDMRTELRTGNLSPISRTLFEGLEEVIEADEQAILFLNRRGYHASLQCKNCGTVLTCPHCSVAMTHHTGDGGRLLCHLCGHREPVPRECPTCHGTHISYIGFGTQKVEGELFSTLGEAKVLRMDADTATARADYERLLDTFRAGEANVLLGTQMVTKGHDFPRVTLVGVLLADTGMYVNDFRASERTFSLLTQVIGRAGRAGAPGRAIIQTYSPQNDVIRLAQAQDYVAFYESEIRLREELCFPPFCDIVQLTFSSPQEGRAREAADRCLARAKELTETAFSNLPLQIFGPMEAQVYKVAEQYRIRLVCKCRWNRPARELFRILLSEGWEKHRVAVSIDVNPLHT